MKPTYYYIFICGFHLVRCGKMEHVVKTNKFGKITKSVQHMGKNITDQI